MKATLISVRKPHSTNIFDRIKTVEWRKRPLPRGLCLVYEPKNGGGCGKVIGEMIIAGSWQIPVNKIPKWCIKDGCVSEDFLKEYANGKEYLYANVIHMAHRFDKPKEITDFKKYSDCEFTNECINCIEYSEVLGKCSIDLRLTRPPQSIVYIEV